MNREIASHCINGILIFGIAFELFFFLIELSHHLLPTNKHLCQFNHDEYFSLFSIAFTFSWWMIYFCSEEITVPSLRAFIRDHSYFRGESCDLEENDLKDAYLGMVIRPQKNFIIADYLKINILKKTESTYRNDAELLKDKSRSTISTVAAFIAIITFLIGTINITRLENSEKFSEFLRPHIITLGLLTILIFIFCIITLDVISNKFTDPSGNANPKSDLKMKLDFFRKTGPNWPAGGIKYAYFGYAIFTLILTMAVAFFNAQMTFLFTCLFIYLGYPILFGYKNNRVYPDKPFYEIDPKMKTPSIIHLAVFIFLYVLSQQYSLLPWFEC